MLPMQRMPPIQVMLPMRRIRPIAAIRSSWKRHCPMTRVSPRFDLETRMLDTETVFHSGGSHTDQYNNYEWQEMSDIKEAVDEDKP